MVYSRFTWWVFLRAALVSVSVMALIVAAWVPGFHGVTLLMSVMVIGQLVELNRYVNRTNTELSRFFEAARSGDFSQRYTATDNKAGFASLAVQFSEIMSDVERTRKQQEESLRHLTALTDHIPVPLMSLFPDGRLNLHNNAARRLLGQAPVARLEDLARFGTDFYEAMSTLEPGNRRLVRFVDDGMERQLSVLASRIVTGTRSETLVSMQDIQSELDANQLQTWHELVRVLTHEIMNSLTPVASLAKTASDLTADACGKLSQHLPGEPLLEDFNDIRQAVDTVARRSDGMMQFVQNYRSLTQLPVPNKQPLLVAQLFQQLQALKGEQWQASRLNLTTRIQPDSLQVSADADLLTQVLINLLTNADQALVNQAQPVIQLSARVNQRGHVVIDVSDNGPGIPEDIAGKVFVPFFTTKRDGSGVGLALARQIMMAHGGSITLGASELGGARFSLVF